MAESRSLIQIAGTSCSSPDLSLMVLSVNLLGDGMRDVLDPRREGAGDSAASQVENLCMHL